MVFFEHSVLNL